MVTSLCAVVQIRAIPRNQWLSLVDELQAGQEDSGKLVQGLKEICEVLQQGDVSSFELIHSGMVAALLDLFAEPGSEAFVHNAKIILQVFAGVDVVSTFPRQKHAPPLLPLRQMNYLIVATAV